MILAALLNFIPSIELNFLLRHYLRKYECCCDGDQRHW